MSNTTAFIVNAFTKDDSGGSPTGVVLKAGSLTTVQMQNIADQIGKSHTAFVTEIPGKASEISIRFFTPTGEILNCGHGAIAAHYANAKENGYSNHVVFQHAKEGLQKVEIAYVNDDIEIRLKQNEIRFSKVMDHSVIELLDALRLEPLDLDGAYPPTLASPGSNRYLLAVNSVEKLNRIAPDLGRLKILCDNSKSIGCFLYVVTSVNPNWEATARMFAPSIGIPEDIINGNSSGCLGAYLFGMTNENELCLKVGQGQRFKHDGIVYVIVKRKEDQIETIIGGKAKIMDQLVVEY